jgi:hypothetical protein
MRYRLLRFFQLGGNPMSDGPDWLPLEVDTGVAHSARVYDYWLGCSA